MIKSLTSVILLFSLFLFSCSSDVTEKEALAYATEDSAVFDTAESSEGGFQKKDEVTVEKNERKLIKEGALTFETSDLNATRKQIATAVQKYKGYVSSDEEHSYNGKKSQTMQVRIPSEHFDSFLTDATHNVKHFDRKSIDVKDVTEEFVDIQARLKAKKELEQRYLELLKEAKNVAEMLEVEREIGELRSEIESYEGRLNLIKDQVRFSTVDITFYERVPKENKFGSKFSRGFRNGWEGLIYFFIGLVNAWPFIIIAAVAWILIRKWMHRRNQEKA